MIHDNVGWIEYNSRANYGDGVVIEISVIFHKPWFEWIESTSMTNTVGPGKGYRYGELGA